MGPPGSASWWRGHEERRGLGRRELGAQNDIAEVEQVAAIQREIRDAYKYVFFLHQYNKL